MPVSINGVISLGFTIDSGASDVTTPSDVASTLIRAGTISQEDYIGSQTSTLADGSTVPSPEFRIRSLKIGTLVLHNVVGSLTKSAGGLLLGQSFLSRLENWSIDNKRHMLILKAGAGTAELAAADPLRDSDLIGAYGSAPRSRGVASDSKQETIPSESASPADTTPALGNDQETPGATADAETVMTRYFAAWSDPQDPDGDGIRRFYGQRVRFYGSDVLLDALMVKKVKFARRWPSRSYTIRPSSLSINCAAVDRTCSIEGLFDWTATNPIRPRRSAGLARFGAILRDGLIIMESGSVVTRD